MTQTRGWFLVLPITAASLLVILSLTGVALMFFYNPATATAWGSAWYIQTQVPYGWLVRGMHRFSADGLLAVLVLYGVQLLVTKHYGLGGGRLWWSTLTMTGLVLAASLTGELLVWDQDGYWGTVVRTNILAMTPGVGRTMKAALLGGSEPGNLTLARFYALHVVLVPAVAAAIVCGYVRACRNNAQASAGAAATVQSSSAGKAAGERPISWRRIASATIVALVTAVSYAHWFHGFTGLSAPADPATSDYPARPEWHTLFLFQWLKYFQGPTREVVGAIVVPAAVVLALFAIPLLRPWLGRRLAHAVAVMVALIPAAGALWLSVAAILTDRRPAADRVTAIRAKQSAGEELATYEELALRAEAFNVRRAEARRDAERAIELAGQHGIPPIGAHSLLREDPQTRGPELFAAHCASCHRFDGHDGLSHVPVEPAASSDLAGYGSRDWIRSFLADPMGDRHFGRMKKPDGTPAHTRMAEWLEEQHADAASAGSEDELSTNLDAVAAYLADESQHPGRLAGTAADAEPPESESQVSRGSTGSGLPESPVAAGAKPTSSTVPQPDDALIRRGRAFFMTACNECHSYDGERSGTFRAPEMRGYGSAEWIELMIAEPDGAARYGSRGKEPAQMPRFADRLTPSQRRMIAEWLHASRTPEHGLR